MTRKLSHYEQKFREGRGGSAPEAPAPSPEEAGSSEEVEPPAPPPDDLGSDDGQASPDGAEAGGDAVPGETKAQRRARRKAERERAEKVG